MRSTLKPLQGQASSLQLGPQGLMGPATLGLGSHVDSPHGSLRLVSLEIQQPGLSPSRINWCGPWGHAPKQQPRGQPASCSWRCESKHERHRLTTSELSCTHISLPTRTWFSGSGWQLGCAPGSRILIPLPVLTVEEYKGSLTPAPRRIMFQVLSVRPCPCCLDCSASHWAQVTPPRNSGGTGFMSSAGEVSTYTAYTPVRNSSGVLLSTSESRPLTLEPHNAHLLGHRKALQIQEAPQNHPCVFSCLAPHLFLHCAWLMCPFLVAVRITAIFS